MLRYDDIVEFPILNLRGSVPQNLNLRRAGKYINSVFAREYQSIGAHIDYDWSRALFSGDHMATAITLHRATERVVSARPPPSLDSRELLSHRANAAARSSLLSSHDADTDELETVQRDKLPCHELGEQTENASHNLDAPTPSSAVAFANIVESDWAVENLTEQWEDWLETYSRGIYSISAIPRPQCLSSCGEVSAPLHYNEGMRLASVRLFLDHRVRNSELEFARKAFRRILRQHRLKAAWISVLTESQQINILDMGNGRLLDRAARHTSLDAHTILSKDNWILVDATADWRTKLSPVVMQAPFVKFYVGIPLFFRGHAIGAVAVCDPFIRAQIPQGLAEQLSELSSSITRYFEDRLLHRESLPMAGGSVRSASTDTHTDARVDISEDSNFSHAYVARSRQAAFSALYVSRAAPTRFFKAALQVELFRSLEKSHSIAHLLKKSCHKLLGSLNGKVAFVSEIRSRRVAPALQETAVPEGSLSQPRRKWIKPQILCSSSTPQEERARDLAQSSLEILTLGMCSPFGIQFVAKEPKQSESDRRDQQLLGLAIPFLREFGPDGECLGGFIMCAILPAVDNDLSRTDRVQSTIKRVVSTLTSLLPYYSEKVRSS